MKLYSMKSKIYESLKKFDSDETVMSNYMKRPRKEHHDYFMQEALHFVMQDMKGHTNPKLVMEILEEEYECYGQC